METGQIVKIRGRSGSRVRRIRVLSPNTKNNKPKIEVVKLENIVFLNRTVNLGKIVTLTNQITSPKNMPKKDIQVLIKKGMD